MFPYTGIRGMRPAIHGRDPARTELKTGRGFRTPTEGRSSANTWPPRPPERLPGRQLL